MPGKQSIPSVRVHDNQLGVAERPDQSGIRYLLI